MISYSLIDNTLNGEKFVNHIITCNPKGVVRRMTENNVHWQMQFQRINTKYKTNNVNYTYKLLLLNFYSFFLIA